MHQDQGRQGVLPRSNPTHTAIRAARGETNDRDLQGRDCGPIRAVGIGLKTIILPVLRTSSPQKQRTFSLNYYIETTLRVSFA